MERGLPAHSVFPFEQTYEHYSSHQMFDLQMTSLYISTMDTKGFPSLDIGFQRDDTDMIRDGRSYEDQSRDESHCKAKPRSFVAMFAIQYFCQEFFTFEVSVTFCVDGRAC